VHIIWAVLVTTSAWSIELEDIRAAYQEKYDQLKTYRVEYEETREIHAADGKPQKPVTFGCVFQGKGQQFTLKMYDGMTTGSPWLLTLKGYDGHTIKEAQFSPTGALMGNKESKGNLDRAYTLTASTYLALVGLHTARHEAESEAISPSHTTNMQICLADPRTRLLPEIEEVNGLACYVIEFGGFFRAWLARDKGFALVKRESSNTKSVPRVVFNRVVCDDFREFAPGFFLPMKVSHDADKTAAPQFGYSMTTCKLTSVKLNPLLEDSDFAIALPPKPLLERLFGG
jgi:hypothetical protein